MRYYATASGPAVREAMRAGQLGMIATPASGNRVEPGIAWIADNSAYTGRYPGDERYLVWLAARVVHCGQCGFATAPDIVGDAAATWARSRPVLPHIRELGYRAALVAQDGLEHLDVDWAAFDALFLGGTTAWKLGPTAAGLASHARSLGLWVHMGRVNSLTRIRYAASIGCDSVDGTYLAYGPDRNLPKLLDWLALTSTPVPCRPRLQTGLCPQRDGGAPPPAGPHHGADGAGRSPAGVVCITASRCSAVATSASTSTRTTRPISRRRLVPDVPPNEDRAEPPRDLQ